ncbi:hypothetical protein MIND_00122500 [Mycena indigotica]|uniref:F-box domain-containing protein n=1 Tax=Mycena indigotica TaxID=2126181 RepID=A0A8H6TCI1_9AGAR|nr:uncharacterized protein MIND_00122500 [Mycena indigotica]KAF7316048.1 hypothetical protein MIND_00122500 [Mycena indigotica]
MPFSSPPPTPSYQLPQELIDTVVESLATSSPEDHEILRACSIASRSFVRPCQQRLFHSLRLYTSRHSFCTRGDAVSAVNIVTRLARLLESSPHLGAYVKEVSIAYPKNVLDENSDDYSAYICSLRAVFQALPGVAALSIQPRAISWDDIWNIYSLPPDLGPAILPAPPCEFLQRLELTRIHLATINELESIVAVTPNLRHLVLRDIMIYEVDEREEPPPQPGTADDTRIATLESLELRVVPSYFYQEALEAFAQVKTITNLRSVCIDEYDDLILSTNAATLEEIILIRRHGQDVHLIGTALLDLLCNDVLRHFHLKLTSDLTNLHTNIQHIRVLTNTRTTFAQNKTVFINLQDTELLYSLLSDIDDLFGGSHLVPGPQRIVMQLAFQGRTEDVRQLMPLLHARGILEVVELSPDEFTAATRQYRCSECYDV